jgi:hypothetical protein
VIELDSQSSPTGQVTREAHLHRLRDLEPPPLDPSELGVNLPFSPPFLPLIYPREPKNPPFLLSLSFALRSSSGLGVGFSSMLASLSSCA